MRKQEFLAKLRKDLSDLPQDEVTERLTFYSEMIDDRMEEGLSEEEAVAAIGTADEITTQITMEKPSEKRGLKVWEIVMLVLGSPVWLSLLLAAAAVVLSLYISLWAVVGSLWSVFVSLVVCAFFTVAAGVGLLFAGKGVAGIALLGAALVCAGLSIFLFFGCKAATKGVCRLAVLMVQWIKTRFVRREEQYE